MNSDQVTVGMSTQNVPAYMKRIYDIHVEKGIFPITAKLKLFCHMTIRLQLIYPIT
jgi:hypothetical protein